MDPERFSQLQRDDRRMAAGQNPHAVPPLGHGDPYLEQLVTSQGAPGLTPHLMQLLEDEYRREIAIALDKKKTPGQPVTPAEIDNAFRKAPASSFIAFATRYLDEFRAVESFVMDANHGVRLGNNKLVSLAPDRGQPGQMQDAATVQVTSGRGQPGQEGVYVGPGAIPI